MLNRIVEANETISEHKDESKFSKGITRQKLKNYNVGQCYIYIYYQEKKDFKTIFIIYIYSEGG